MTTTVANLNLLAEQIKNDIDRRNKNHAEWIDATLDLCVHLAEARAAFPANDEFGRWCDAGGFKLSHQDRAAAVAMGKEADRARQVLEATERRSLQLIHAHEFRLTSASKTPRPKSQPISTERERAFAAYDRRKAAGEELTWEAVRVEAGTGHTVVRAVFTARETEERVKAELASEMDSTQLSQERAKLLEEMDADRMAHLAAMSPAQRKRFNAHVAAFRQELADTIASQVSAGISKWAEETGIALYIKQLEKMETMLTSPLGAVMHKTEYNVIQRCLHPDTAPHKTDQERAEAFRIFTHYKLKMVNDEEERINARRELRSNMPKTLEEMLARRRRRA